MKSLLFEAVDELVRGAEHILLITDQRADGDTYGSSLAFSEYLRSLGKRVSHYASSEIPDSLSFLPGIEDTTYSKDVIVDPTVELAIVFDTSREDQINALLVKRESKVPLIVFDHHKTNSGFGDVSIVDATVSSTCELVHGYFIERKVTVTRDMAKCLITGIMTDTRVFANPLTKENSMEIAAELLMAGGSIQNVVNNIIMNYPLKRLQLWGRIFERIVKIPSLNLAVAYVTRADLNETGTVHEDYSEIMDYMAANLDVEVVMFLKELEGEEGIKVSMRSHNVDVSKLAKMFPGGGGHPGACGFTVRGKLAREGKKMVIK